MNAIGPSDVQRVVDAADRASRAASDLRLGQRTFRLVKWLAVAGVIGTFAAAAGLVLAWRAFDRVANVGQDTHRSVAIIQKLQADNKALQENNHRLLVDVENVTDPNKPGAIAARQATADAITRIEECDKGYIEQLRGGPPPTGCP